MAPKVIVTPEFIEKAKILKEQGLRRKDIASNLGVSYGTIAKIFGTERLGIDRSKKEPWTIENLVRLKDNYKTMPVRELCLMFNRDRYEIRQLLSHLGWDIPEWFFKRNKQEVIDKVIELSKEHNQAEISAMINVSRAQIQSICSNNNIKCSTKRRPKLSASEIMNNAYREQADAIRVKLRGHYIKSEK